MRGWDKIQHSSWLVETVIWLGLARWMLALFSFQQLVWFFERPARTPELLGPGRAEQLRLVSSLIYRFDHWLPGRITCFHRAIAAQAMLRRRHISTSLYYGAITSAAGELKTHAWVQDGEQGVVGYWTARQDGYRVLACYPEHTGD